MPLIKPSVDPLELAALLWPDVVFYSKQREILDSVIHNDETIVPAGNMLGKDFIAGYVALWFFLAFKEVRIITTSVKDDHLRVLWGEIGRFVQSCKYPLDVAKGGPLILNHRDIRKTKPLPDGTTGVCQISYLRGMVSMKGEGMAGHHAPATLCVIDEASGVDDLVYTQCDTWARRKLIIGNPNPPGPNARFFYDAVKKGDVVAVDY